MGVAASFESQQPIRRAATLQLRALALDLRPDPPPLAPGWGPAIVALHLLGLGALAQLTRQPGWLLLIPALAALPLTSWRRERVWAAWAPSPAPLGLAYGVALVRFVGRRLAPGWQPTAGWFNLDYVLVLAALWTLAGQCGLAWRMRGRSIPPAALLGVTLLALALGWTAWAGLALHTRGVTGTDPYAYTQMGVDLARGGSVRHTFVITRDLAALGVDPRPLVPLGYLAPDAATGVAATVWPPGQAVLLAVGYLLGGERGLYVTTPVLGLAALAALWLLAVEALRGWPRDARFLAAGVAVALMATSFEQIDRQLTPMADIPAQLFSLLALYGAVRGTRARTHWPAALAGVCLGAAFDLRYTQVLLAPALAWLLLSDWRERGRRRALTDLVVCGGAALLVAAPVLCYHQRAFGGALRVGSEELALFSLDAVRRTLPRMLREVAQPREFRYALPLALVGAAVLWRQRRRVSVALGVALGVVVAFHLLYEALRLRDLLPVLPIVALWAGVGLARVWAWLGETRHPTGRAAAHAAIVLAIALLVSSDATLLLPVPPMHYNAFGYLVDSQRASLDQLAALTPLQAVVAASQNSGAVTLHAERDIVRPGAWSPDEWLAVAEQLRARGRPLYLLADGEEMLAPIEALRAVYTLEPVDELSLPYFYPGGGSENRDIPLYRVQLGGSAQP